jgi:adenosine deaminase
MNIRWFLTLSLYLIASLFTADAFADVQQKFERIKTNPVQLRQFIAKMPKGGDLHLHLAGGITPLQLLEISKHGDYQFCEGASICPHGEAIAAYLGQLDNYARVVWAWSMPKLPKGEGHDHFFATFLKFWPIVFDNRGAILAQMLRDAERQHIHYLELMVLADNNKAATLSHDILWHGDYDRYTHQLMQRGLSQLIKKLPAALDRIEAKARQLLACEKRDRPACKVVVRYQAIVLREQSLGSVFAEMVAGFELAKRDPRVVAINLVQAEDGDIALHDYHQHMKMLDYFHPRYPHVKISLHAGELKAEQSKRHDLTFHISEAITLGHASRIGHGVTIPYEKNLGGLLHRIKSQHILFEINLSSNFKILDLAPHQHPFRWLLKRGVPMSLSTDDPGVLRTDLNHEYVLAVQIYNLDYNILKRLNRNSLHYSFLPGQSLWQSVKVPVLTPACRNASFAQAAPKSCQDFLNKNPKAALQWRFEQALWAFEHT